MRRIKLTRVTLIVKLAYICTHRKEIMNQSKSQQTIKQRARRRIKVLTLCSGMKKTQWNKEQTVTRWSKLEKETSFRFEERKREMGSINQ